MQPARKRLKATEQERTVVAAAEALCVQVKVRHKPCEDPVWPLDGPTRVAPSQAPLRAPSQQEKTLHLHKDNTCSLQLLAGGLKW